MTTGTRTVSLGSLALLVGIVVLLGSPIVAGAPSKGVAGAPDPREAVFNPQSVHVVSSAAGTAVHAVSGANGPIASHAISLGTSVGRPAGSSLLRGGPGSPLSKAPAAPAAKAPNPYAWSSAFIGYSSTDPASRMFGEGAGLASDNALDELVWFGGLATGGLSNVTFEYWWWFNATNILNSSEGWNYTHSPTSPTARTNLSFASYQAADVALLFGGLTNLKSQRTANDSWIYNFTQDRWTNVTAPGAPPPRESAAFAVDQKDGIALLFGGIAPSFSSHGSNGSVIWRDTWEFRFATNRWTEIFPSVVPSGRFGGSMVWDSVDNEFLLAAGCGLSCTMDAWAFHPATSQWSPLNETGQIPSARAGASFAWDPGAHVAVLYGGYSFDANGDTLVYFDAYRLLPSGEWDALYPSAPGPPPLYRPGPVFDAATTWSNFEGCNVMWVVGGNPALRDITSMVYVIQPTNDSPYYQCWWWWQEPAPPPQPPPPCSRTSELVVTVENAANRVRIPKAVIAISGQCLPAIGVTNPSGSFEFTLNTPDNLTLNVSANGFHGNRTWYNYTYTNTTANTSGTLIRYIVVLLVPFPSINVRVLGNDGGVFLLPVANAVVALYNSTVLAITGPTGWGNSSAVSAFNRTAVISAWADNYSTSWKKIFVPYTGPVNATLVLLRAGTLVVRVADARTGRFIANAFGEVTRLDPGLPPPFSFRTGPDGSFSRMLPIGNYTASAGAVGYLTNASGGRAFLPWVRSSTITILLTLDYGTNLSVRLVNDRTGKPIAGGLVTFGESRPYVTNPDGWGNGTNLGPPGRARVLGTATGYAPNSTMVVFGHDLRLPAITLRLTPLCPGAACPAVTAAGGSQVSPLLPAGGSALLLLLFAPAFLVLAGALYAFGSTARRARPSGAAPRAVPPLRSLDRGAPPPAEV